MNDTTIWELEDVIIKCRIAIETLKSDLASKEDQLKVRIIADEFIQKFRQWERELGLMAK